MTKAQREAKKIFRAIKSKRASVYTFDEFIEQLNAKCPTNKRMRIIKELFCNPFKDESGKPKDEFLVAYYEFELRKRDKLEKRYPKEKREQIELSRRKLFERMQS